MMKVYKYTHRRRGYDMSLFEENGIVFAQDEMTAKDRIMDEYWNDGEVIMLEETYVIPLKEMNW